MHITKNFSPGYTFVSFALLTNTNEQKKTPSALGIRQGTRIAKKARISEDVIKVKNFQVSVEKLLIQHILGGTDSCQ